MKVNVSEIFTSIQGEGLYAGRPSVFLRLSGCNLRCEWDTPTGRTRCDTPYASFEPERNMFELDDLVLELAKRGTNDIDHLVITGGEPTMQSEALNEICEQLDDRYIITIETNGTKVIRNKCVSLISISPKINTVVQSWPVDTVIETIEANTCETQLKFVVATPEDIERVKTFVQAVYAETCNGFETMLMPEGRTPAEVDAKLPWVAQACIDNNWILADRLHLRVWGGERGR